MGQGLHIKMMQIAASELGVPVDKVCECECECECELVNIKENE